MKIKLDNNPLDWMAAGCSLAALVALGLTISGGLPAGAGCGVAGILLTLVGTVWIGSGVYLLSSDVKKLSQSTSTQGLSESLRDAIFSASKKMPFGIVYIVLGSGFQIVSYLI